MILNKNLLPVSQKQYLNKTQTNVFLINRPKAEHTSRVCTNLHECEGNCTGIQQMPVRTERRLR